MDAHQAYNRFLNFMVRRVIAVLFIVVGSIVALSFLPALVTPDGSVLVNGVSQSGLGYRILAVAFPLAFVVVGVLLYMAPPFKPPSTLE
jgi:hypothetical protein